MTPFTGPVWLLILLDAVRLVAAIAGPIVGWDAGQAIAGRAPFHEVSDKAAAWKWLLGGVAGLVVGGTIFLSSRVPSIGPNTTPNAVLLLIGWICFSGMLAMRATARAQNQRAIAAALVLAFFGGVVAGMFGHGMI